MGVIYKATNLKNGKIYIGKTTKTLKERMKSPNNGQIKKGQRLSPTTEFKSL